MKEERWEDNKDELQVSILYLKNGQMSTLSWIFYLLCRLTFGFSFFQTLNYKSKLLRKVFKIFNPYRLLALRGWCDSGYVCEYVFECVRGKSH